MDSTDALTRFGLLKKLTKAVPYPSGHKALSLAIGSIPLKYIGMASAAEQFATFFAALKGVKPHRGDLQRYLLTNFMASWRLYALARLSSSEFGRYVAVSGLDAVKNILAEGRGVVLCNSHFGAGKAGLLPLIRDRIKVASLDRRDVFSYMDIPNREYLASITLTSQEGFHMKEMFKARQVLMEGGILHVAADGLRGQSGIVVDYFGIKRRFASGFSELALATGAAIVPVLSRIDESGRINVDYFHNWTGDSMSDESGGNDTSLDATTLTSKYAEFLKLHWKQDPASVFKYEVANFHRHADRRN